MTCTQLQAAALVCAFIALAITNARITVLEKQVNQLTAEKQHTEKP